MSDYVRKRAIRYKLKDNEVDSFKNKAQDKCDYLPDIMLRELGLKEIYDIRDETDGRYCKFTINFGYNYFEQKQEYYLDFILYYEYGAGGDFEFCRELTEKENEKFIPYFQKNFPNFKIDELRYVDYSYYNGVDEPTVWKPIELSDIHLD